MQAARHSRSRILPTPDRRHGARADRSREKCPARFERRGGAQCLAGRNRQSRCCRDRPHRGRSAEKRQQDRDGCADFRGRVRKRQAGRHRRARVQRAVARGRLQSARHGRVVRREADQHAGHRLRRSERDAAPPAGQSQSRTAPHLGRRAYGPHAVCGWGADERVELSRHRLRLCDRVFER